MATTFEKIATVTASAVSASVQFTSISSAYTDLCVYASVRNNTTGTVFDPSYIQANGWPAYGWNRISIKAQTPGTPAGSYATNNSEANTGIWNAAGSTANNYTYQWLYFPLSGTRNGATMGSMAFNFSALETANSGGYLWVAAYQVQYSNAYSSITIASANGNGFAANSKFTLYGIKKA
jgi:hypothetical protein